MSRESKKFGVPDDLANLYDFANTLDVRHFTHHGVPHPQGDELTSARELASWMSQRGLAPTSAKLTPAMFATVIELRTLVRDYLQCDPLERHANKDAARALGKTLRYFPLVVAAGDDGMVLRAAREDALAGLSPIVAELYDGSRNGTLDRLKMCASDECRRVFFDRSKPSTRRWCMSSLCGNRMKTRSYRERQRNAG
ncbi:CGNR zinc finger domain-containing protein [Bradyrhizobium sp. JYMT SZCCT0180]|uniref:CGNR zinc finger domain-containing protein n=1 Tax=Bradyrhizobium sp. JYMT SZCCT0180 TaxID=2807666 RepID=UPI001BACD493|nr:CGNR zinc finger domain-containing protein [Bradyrhizobium sp. JYMT SZCCT0180]MBR1209903.1 CGNR zinc finger domain-containing protein [Bradyrhizobium sp. JYMT SZCCT0180]